MKLTKKQRDNWRIRTNEALASDYERETAASWWEIITNLLDTCDSLEAELAAAGSQLKNITENAYILENTIRLLRTENADWKCKANPTADPPQDCDFPFCGCDPNAIKVIETLQESGWIGPKEASDREKAAIAAALESLKPLSGKWRKNGHHPFATSLDEVIAALITPDQSAARK